MKWVCERCHAIQPKLGSTCYKCGLSTATPPPVGKYDEIKRLIKAHSDHELLILKRLTTHGDPHSRMAHAHHGSISAYEQVLRDIAELESEAVIVD